MTVREKTRANQLSCLVTIFSLQTINYGEKLWLRATTQANLQPKLKYESCLKYL